MLKKIHIKLLTLMWCPFLMNNNFVEEYKVLFKKEIDDSINIQKNTFLT